MKKKLIISIISVIIIIIGTVIGATVGFEEDLEYKEHTKMIVYMNKESNIDDIKQIVKDTFDGKFKVSYTDEFSDTISINAQGISEEQITRNKKQINRKI